MELYVREELIELRLIDPPRDPLRTTLDPETLGQLADSMAAEGLLQPIGVSGPDATGRYEVIWGHRRYEAAKLLQWARIPAKVHAPGTDPLLARASENLQRADMSPLDEARAVARFIEAGQPRAAVARLLRRSVGWVDARLDLLTLPGDLASAVERRELSMAVAHELRSIDHAGYRAQLIEEARQSGATANTAAVWAAHWARDRARLIANHATVEQILGEAKHFRIMVGCEACEEPTDVTGTALLRLCPECNRNVRAAIAEGRRQAADEAPNGSR